MDELNWKADEKILNLLSHSLDKRNTDKVRDTKRANDDFSNLVRADLFSLFPNVKTLIIDSTYQQYSYSFSLRAFLDTICQTNLDEITIKSKQYGGNKTWIQILGEKDKELLKQEYAAKNYRIE